MNSRKHSHKFQLSYSTMKLVFLIALLKNKHIEITAPMFQGTDVFLPPPLLSLPPPPRTSARLVFAVGFGIYLFLSMGTGQFMQWSLQWDITDSVCIITFAILILFHLKLGSFVARSSLPNVTGFQFIPRHTMELSWAFSFLCLCTQ